MNAMETKLNYFKSKLEQVKSFQATAKIAADKFDAEFQTWMREQGMPEQYTMVELISHFVKRRRLKEKKEAEK